MRLFDKYEDCCGCGECVNICPKNAISMKSSPDGFFYPSIDDSKCVDCGLCKSNCKFNKVANENYPLEYIVAKANDTGVLDNSTSGGMYTLISDYILNNRGVIYAPCFDSEMNLKHTRISDFDTRDLSTGSKYVQSMFSTYNEIADDSIRGLTIAFFGTPCQVYALQNYLSNRTIDCSNILFVDLVCNGVGSPLAWSRHKERIEKKYRKTLRDYKFRTKSDGYNSSDERAVFIDGTKTNITSYIYRYNPLYHSRLIIRPSCNNCKFNSMNRISDITIGDFSKEQVDLSFNRKGGVSSVLVNSEKGLEIFNRIKKSITFQNVSCETITQIRLKECGKRNPESDKFFKNLNNRNMEYAIYKWLGPIKYSKSILYHNWMSIKRLFK